MFFMEPLCEGRLEVLRSGCVKNVKTNSLVVDGFEFFICVLYGWDVVCCILVEGVADCDGRFSDGSRADDGDIVTILVLVLLGTTVLSDGIFDVFALI
jgi:hypothetical protein